MNITKFLNPKIVVLLGNSNSGKDHIAKTHFIECEVFKLNQIFKDIFEVDHGLKPGTCNVKSLRNKILEVGQFKGLTIAEAMIKCYQQSESFEPSYGLKFKNMTMSNCKYQLIENPKNYVITDLRKISEAKEIEKIAIDCLYNLEVYEIQNKFSKPLDSDLNVEFLCKYLNSSPIINHYDFNQNANAN